MFSVLIFLLCIYSFIYHSLVSIVTTEISLVKATKELLAVDLKGQYSVLISLDLVVVHNPFCAFFSFKKSLLLWLSACHSLLVFIIQCQPHSGFFLHVLLHIAIFQNSFPDPFLFLYGPCNCGRVSGERS